MTMQAQSIHIEATKQLNLGPTLIVATQRMVFSSVCHWKIRVTFRSTVQATPADGILATVFIV